MRASGQGHQTAALFMASVTRQLADQAWAVGLALTLLAIRTPKEEEMLIERFGQQYREYGEDLGGVFSPFVDLAVFDRTSADMEKNGHTLVHRRNPNLTTQFCLEPTPRWLSRIAVASHGPYKPCLVPTTPVVLLTNSIDFQHK